jgi:hypothetical protein
MVRIAKFDDDITRIMKLKMKETDPWFKGFVPTNAEGLPCIDCFGQGSLYYSACGEKLKLVCVKITNGIGKRGETGGTTWSDFFETNAQGDYWHYVLPCDGKIEPEPQAGRVYDASVGETVRVVFTNWKEQKSGMSKNYEVHAKVLEREGKWGRLELPKPKNSIMKFMTNTPGPTKTIQKKPRPA